MVVLGFRRGCECCVRVITFSIFFQGVSVCVCVCVCVRTHVCCAQPVSTDIVRLSLGAVLIVCSILPLFLCLIEMQLLSLRAQIDAKLGPSSRPGSAGTARPGL